MGEWCWTRNFKTRFKWEHHALATLYQPLEYLPELAEYRRLQLHFLHKQVGTKCGGKRVYRGFIAALPCADIDTHHCVSREKSPHSIYHSSLGSIMASGAVSPLVARLLCHLFDQCPVWTFSLKFNSGSSCSTITLRAEYKMNGHRTRTTSALGQEVI